MTAPDLRIEILPEPRLLKAVRGLVRGYMNAQGFVPERAEEVVLAVDEACANSIRHSYAREPCGAVALEFRSDEHEVMIELRDAGIPAPSDRVRRKPAPAPNVATLRPGGLGVQLIYQVFDDVEFRPGSECGNHVIMRLRRTPADKQNGTAEEG